MASREIRRLLISTASLCRATLGYRIRDRVGKNICVVIKLLMRLAPDNRAIEVDVTYWYIAFFLTF